MHLKILCPQWGSEYLGTEVFLQKVKQAGYDGIEAAVPEDKKERQKLIRLLEEYNLIMVSHQHQAAGENFSAFCKSFEYHLQLSTETNPVLINSHSGRDWFTLEEQLKILDIAETFSSKHNIQIAHETHRGRIGYCPQNLQQIFHHNKSMKVTADLSHWVCVTESYLEHFQDILNETIARTVHFHARVGFHEGPQIPDPRIACWSESVNIFMSWWKRIIEQRDHSGTEEMTITCEFGPAPYMWTSVPDNQPVVSQWDVNVYIMQLLRKTFKNNG